MMRLGRASLFQNVFAERGLAPCARWPLAQERWLVLVIAGGTRVLANQET